MRRIVKYFETNRLRGFRILLPSSDSIIKALEKIIKMFESPIEMEGVKTRWEEIKKFNLTSKLNVSSHIIPLDIYS